tara:strand:+ start:62 stop:310 length:249 start_codon:yes stop_codon:yes gene_type:complete
MSTIADALLAALISPNETDRNLEDANVVDGLFAISRGLNRIASAIDRLGFGDELQNIDGTRVIVTMEAAPLNRIAKALEEKP